MYNVTVFSEVLIELHIHMKMRKAVFILRNNLKVTIQNQIISFFFPPNMEYKIGFSSKQLSSYVNSGQLGHGNGTMSPWTVQVCTNVRHREVSLNFPIIGVNIWIELFFVRVHI